MTAENSPLALATELTIAWLANPNTRTTAENVPSFLKSMHDAVSQLSLKALVAGAEAASPEYVPAVTARKSLADKAHILSMIDGKPYKSLRRHLSRHGLTPEQYRERYKLKPDYPMVAQAYSESRRAMAKALGLGRKADGKVAQPTEDAPLAKARTPKARRRKAFSE